MLRKLLQLCALVLIAGAQGAEPLRISNTTMPVSASLLLASELGWLKDAGLNVQIKDYPLGKLALEALAQDEIDIAAAAVTPIVFKVLAGADLRIFASVASSTGMVAIVARKDRGIASLPDLQGKKIGIALGTSGEFFFETLRVLNRIPKTSLAIEDRTLEGLVTGMKDGSLDAASVWEPQISEIHRAMPNQLSAFHGAGLYTFTWSLVAKPQLIESRKPELEKLLQTFFRVAQFIQENPDQARSILIQRYGERGRDLAKFLGQTSFLPNLSQDLLVALEGEARWVINRSSRRGPMPNFLRSIDASVLKSVRPAAVTLVR